MALQFQRNAELYIELTNSAGVVQHTWKLAVLEGFSFTQAQNASEITINEAGEISRRGRLLFNDSLAPAEWSFSSYVRPSAVSGSPSDQTRPVEEALWAMLLGADTFDAGTAVFSNAKFSPGTTNAVDVNTNTFNFNTSNLAAMPDNWSIVFDFVDGANLQTYRINGAAANSVSIDFDIDGIATLAWSGFGQTIEDLGTGGYTPTNLVSALTPALTTTDNFIRNRISTVSLARTDKLVGSPGSDEIKLSVEVGIDATITNNTSPALDEIVINGDVSSSISIGDAVTGTNIPAGTTVTSITYGSPNTTVEVSNQIDGATGVIIFFAPNYDVYNIVLTGGSFSVENNISFLTPEELGLVNKPLANISGARTITGSLTCYLDNDQTTSKSGELFADLVADTETVRNVFDMAINIGGTPGAGKPTVTFDLPTAHLEIPTINVEDLLTLEVNFHGQPLNGNVDATDEATIVYGA